MADPARAAAPVALCDALKAIGDPARWRVIELLAGGERCVCDLEAATELAQSRLSYHLAVLRHAGVVSARREGRWIYYSLSAETLASMAGALTRVADAWRREESATGPRLCD